MNECYEKLAQAIIVTACNDYRKALKRLKKDSWDRDAKATKREVEKFLHSHAFGIYTELNPDKLLEMLKAEVA